MSGLAGLQGLQDQTVYPIPPENILSRSGEAASPLHGEAPYQGVNPNYAGPYPSQGNQFYGPAGVEDPYTGNWSLGQGSYDPDQSPITHAGPFPAHGAAYGELRNGEAQWADQKAGMDAHAADFGTSRLIAENPNGQDYANASWNQWYTESSGTTVTDGIVIPKTILSGEGGGRDREVLGNGGNPHFMTGHIQHRMQSDGVPFNNQWLDSTQRPFTVRMNGLKNTFDGPDSPYGAQGDETQNMMLSPDQAAVMTDPAPYTSPAAPAVAPGLSAAPSADSWAW